MKRWIVSGLIAGVALAAAAVGYTASAAGGPGATFDLVSNSRQDTPKLRAVGLTADQRLVWIQVRDADDLRGIGKVSGLEGDKKLVGIDYRVQDGKLYGVGDAGGVYTLSTSNAKATKVSQLTTALSGTAFGVDFNPAADRLRVVSDTGQNLRHNVVAGFTTLVDGALTYPPATTPAAGVTAVAYTNNDLNADTATVLYDLDTTMDQLAIQVPANSGQLSPIGKFGADAVGNAGFDIYSKVRDGKAVDATGFATLTVNGSSRLYQISLVTGAVDRLGTFPRWAQITDIALPLNQ